MAADDIIEPKWTDELRLYGEGFVGRQDELEGHASSPCTPREGRAMSWGHS